MEFHNEKLVRLIVFPENYEPLRRKILDPSSDIFLIWNRLFLCWCLVALFVDPLYFYLPSVVHSGNSSRMTSDLNFGIIVTCFRTFADVFYLLHMVIKFRTAYVPPNSRVFGRGELVMDPKMISGGVEIPAHIIKLHTLFSHMIFFPSHCLKFVTSEAKIMIWFILRAVRSSHADHTNNALVLIVLLQYVPRLYLIFPLRASWYLLSIERQATCWKSECKNESGPVKCFPHYLESGTLDDNDQGIWENSTLVFNKCNPRFLEKYFYRLWWGLQNLSSYAQSLAISTYIGETLFAVLISILSLVLFAHLIGNMQTYLQSITVRFEEWRLKRRDTEEWMRHRQIPQNLRGLVPFFSQMDDQLPDALCERLVSSLSTLRAQMLFIISGRLESSTTNGGRTGFFNSITLRPGDFCGEELLAWALLSKSTVNLPSSTRTVKALIEVEAFVLRAEDLKFVANQFRRLHSKKLQHTFCFYSHHWRTWPACFIQAAWRHCKKRKMAKNLGMMESFSYVPDEQVACETEQEEEEHRTSTSSQAKQNLNVTILASRFAANTRRVGQKIKGVEMPRLQRPDEPDFSAGADDN
ncbi:hypothetical protein CICLE_v10010159mg [Citrus x clementina]|uniref:Ion transport domain-containing protein n=1 Tax=Citrus clementina TaxID=85681 RepID=V4WAR4_CITCL|nr:hypothetical protein CICLE_v10010159mg [Citrus x clementina]